LCRARKRPASALAASSMVPTRLHLFILQLSVHINLAHTTKFWVAAWPFPPFSFHRISHPHRDLACAHTPDTHAHPGSVDHPAARLQFGYSRLMETKWTHPRFGVGTVWRGDYAGGGWKCLPALGEKQGRHKACPYRTGWGEYCWLDTLLGKIEQGGETGRGVAGAQPLHKGGPKARPPKCEERGVIETD